MKKNIECPNSLYVLADIINSSEDYPLEIVEAAIETSTKSTNVL